MTTLSVETGPARGSGRLRSVDLLRGLVMMLMAIDHVRVFAGVPPGGVTPGLFFTRWVTHFCAPVFIFLAGTGIYLRATSGRAVSRYLVTRGVMLVALELSLLRFAWTFNIGWDRYLLAGVIWVIGWSMIAMAGLVKLPTAVIAVAAAVVIGGHNLLDPLLAAQLQSGTPIWWGWKLLYAGASSGPIPLGEHGPRLHVLYALVPWVGVMAAGYAFGAVLRLEPAERRRRCLQLGTAAVALFVLLRSIGGYGDPAGWSPAGDPESGLPGGLLGFLNTTKYPASLQFLLMTLGPALLVLPLLERVQGVAWEVVDTFGRVPLFYYILHLPVIHLLAIGVSVLRTGAVTPWLFADHPMGAPWPAEGYAWPLGTLYLITGIALALLYLPCRWYELRVRAGGQSRGVEVR